MSILEDDITTSHFFYMIMGFVMGGIVVFGLIYCFRTNNASPPPAYKENVITFSHGIVASEIIYGSRSTVFVKQKDKTVFQYPPKVAKTVNMRLEKE